MSSQCTCTTDKEATCIVHPTTRSLKERIEELEGELDRARVIYVDDINTLKSERNALVEALRSVIKVADRDTDIFNAAKALLPKEKDSE